MESKRKFSVRLPVKGGKKLWETETTNVQHRFLSRVDMLMIAQLGGSPKSFFILDTLRGFLSNVGSLVLKKISFASQDFSALTTYIGRLLDMSP